MFQLTQPTSEGATHARVESFTAVRSGDGCIASATLTLGSGAPFVPAKPLKGTGLILTEQFPDESSICAALVAKGLLPAGQVV